MSSWVVIMNLIQDDRSASSYIAEEPEEAFFSGGVDGPVDGRILVSIDVVSVSGRSSCSGSGVEKPPTGPLLEGSNKVV